MEQLYFDFPNDDILLAHPAGGDQVIPVQVSYDNVEFSINHSGMWAGFPEQQTSTLSSQQRWHLQMNGPRNSVDTYLLEGPEYATKIIAGPIRIKQIEKRIPKLQVSFSCLNKSPEDIREILNRQFKPWDNMKLLSIEVVVDVLCSNIDLITKGFMAFGAKDFSRQGDTYHFGSSMTPRSYSVYKVSKEVVGKDLNPHDHSVIRIKANLKFSPEERPYAMAWLNGTWQPAAYNNVNIANVFSRWQRLTASEQGYLQQHGLFQTIREASLPRNRRQDLRNLARKNVLFPIRSYVEHELGKWAS